MDPRHWQSMMKLFDQAMERSEKDRDAFLDEACRDDPALRRRVAKLLDADGEAGSFLDLDQDRAPTRTPATTPPAAMPAPGDRLGSYKLLRQIGSGGMGIVYLAARDDDAFKRRVAIKLLREGKASADARRRMRQERQVLASLDHPNIAALHDGGTTPSGWPYFVMEYVEGTPIDAYCDHHELPIETRIDLFLEVCDAVESAHRSLVVHRDLKPSNILVSATGVVKLLDFGIAKLLKPDLLGVEGEATKNWMRALTPGYASPEQIAGRAVTTASDVYSLGVLLFKLLTGRLPAYPDLESADLIERPVRDREPPRASEVVLGAKDDPEFVATCRARGLAPEPLARQLAGDLDSILAKALRPSPRHRYGTVAHLVEDLQRHRRHLPVLARKGNLRYQAGKFLRRQRLGVAVAGLLLTFTAVSMVQVDRARREHHRAELENRTKNAVIDLVVGLFETANVYLNHGDQLTVRQVLENAEESFSGAGLEPGVMAGLEPGITAGLEPGIMVTLREVVGKVYLSLGHQEPAARQFRAILELQTKLHGEDSLESAVARGLYGSALRLGHIEDAILEGERAVETIRSLEGEDSRRLVEPLNHLVTSFCYKSDYQAAGKWAQKALALTRRWLGPESVETARALTNSAMVLKKEKRLEEAAKRYREAARILRRHFSGLHPFVLALTSSEASVARAAGQLDLSERIYHRLIELQHRAYRGDHPDIAHTLHNLSVVLLDLGRHDESVEKLLQATQMLERTLGSDHPYAIDFAIRLARRYIKVGRPRKAQELLAERLVDWRLLELGENRSLIPKAEAVLAEASLAETAPMDDSNSGVP